MKDLLDEGSDMQVNMKERDQISLVVETAQDWIERVRQAMNAGEESTLNKLEELLTEAEDIPVNMDEHQLLLCEIKARRWTTEVKDTLQKKNCRVEVLEAHLGEFEKIREAMPLDARAKKNYTLEEEIELRGIIDDVHTWRSKVKKATQSKRSTLLAKYQALVTEAGTIAVNLQSEVRPLESILKKASEWRDAHAELIAMCLTPSSGDNSSAVGDCGAATAMQEGPSTVAFSTLEACIASAEKINAQLEEMDGLKGLLGAGKAWLEKQEILCPKRQTKRSSAKSSVKPSENEVMEHIELARSLPFDFTSGISRLEDNIESARKWREDAKSVFDDLALEQDEAMADENSENASAGDDDFPDADEDLLDRLKGISKEADIVLVRTEEEAIVERFLGVYSWGQDLRAVLDPTSSKCTLSELDRIAKIGNELYSKSTLDAGPSMPPFMRPVLDYGERNISTVNAQLSEAQSWTKAAKKVMEGSGITLKQATELLAKVNLVTSNTCACKPYLPSHLSLGCVNKLRRQILSPFRLMRSSECERICAHLMYG
jgi:hypothetical protein